MSRNERNAVLAPDFQSPVLNLRSVSIFALLLMCVWVSGCSEVAPPPPAEEVRKEAPPAPTPTPTEQKESPQREVVVPPWRLYSGAHSGDPQWTELERLLSGNDLAQAVRVAESALRARPGDEELFATLLGLKLQLGHSKEVLREASQFSSERGIDALSPQIALIIAYAYKHQHDIDQTLAWLGVAVRRGAGTLAGHAAGREIENLLSRIVESGFEQYGMRWEQDLTIAPFFRKERERRARGGMAVSGKETDYFAPETYGSAPQATEEHREFVPLVLVTVSEGRLGKIGESFRRGFEIAREEVSPNLEVEYVEEERALERIGVLSGISAVIGPQQTKTFEELKNALPNEVLYFPLGKQIGAGERVYPLQISKEEELAALIRFAKEGLHVEKPMILLPEGSPLSESSGVVLRVNGESQIEIEAGVDGILSLLPLEESVPLLQRVRAQAPHLPIVLGPEGLDRPVLRSSVGLFEGVYLVLPFFPESERPAVKRFVGRYQKKYQESPTLGAAMSYDLTRILLVRIPEAGTNLLQKLNETNDFESVTGFEGIAGRIQRKFTVLQVRQGEVVERGTNYDVFSAEQRYDKKD